MDVLGQVLPLALIDTVSVATLAIPLWFLLTPHKLRVANIFLYLLFVAVGYLLLGIALLGGLSSGEERIRSAVDSAAGDVLFTVIGITLILLAAWYGLLRKKGPGNGRLDRWRDAVIGDSATVRGVFVIAAIAVILEIATMFPFLIAIDALDNSGYSWPASICVLALYCLVMITPAAIATAGRRLSGDTLVPVLEWVNNWIRRNEREDVAWLLAIAGVLLLSTTNLFDQAMDYLG